MKAGIEAALAGQRVQGRRIEFVALNDSYTPTKTIDATQRLLDQGVFVVIGNVGTPTAKVSLPILAKHKVPAVGFFTGAGILRPGVGDIINYRASYVQETAAVIDAALKAGMTPKNVCAYVQNDAYGMAGVVGIKRALAARPGSAQIIKTIDEILALEGEDPPRNNIGPVGVYKRNTFTSRDGYQSLKNWEERSGAPCRLVVSVGTYNAIARFAGYARYKRENWIISAVSFTGADDFKATLNEFGVTNRVVMTQVVPPLDSNLPIVVEARRALGDDFGYVSLEGYIVGKMLLAAMLNTNGELTRANLLRTIRGRTFELGGLKLDFINNNQGSDLVLTTYLDGNQYRVMTPNVWERMLRL
jgi:ABC-type branched-subunit amino acid transport system substrate-binding protein